MEDKALESAVEKIYLSIAESGVVTQGQLVILKLYQDSHKENVFDELTKFINNVFPVGGNER